MLSIAFRVSVSAFVFSKKRHPYSCFPSYQGLWVPEPRGVQCINSIAFQFAICWLNQFSCGIFCSCVCFSDSQISCVSFHILWLLEVFELMAFIFERLSCSQFSGFLSLVAGSPPPLLANGCAPFSARLSCYFPQEVGELKLAALLLYFHSFLYFPIMILAAWQNCLATACLTQQTVISVRAGTVPYSILCFWKLTECVVHNRVLKLSVDALVQDLWTTFTALWTLPTLLVERACCYFLFPLTTYPHPKEHLPYEPLAGLFELNTRSTFPTTLLGRE